MAVVLMVLVFAARRVWRYPLRPWLHAPTYTHLVPSSYERARLAIDGVFGPTSTDGLEAA